MSLAGRLDALQRRHPGFGYPIAVIYKLFDDTGPYLAALITYYVFVSILPLLLLASTILAFVLQGHPHLQRQLIDSALGEFPVVGAQLKAPNALGGGAVGITIGILGALYGGQGAGQAFQYAANTIWQVPRNSRPNPLRSRGKSTVLMLTVGVGIVGTIVLSSVLEAHAQGTWLQLLIFGMYAVVTAFVFIGTFQLAIARPLAIKDVAIGSAIVGVGWALLQTFGATYVTEVVRRASDLNAVFAFVLGLLAFIYLAAMLVVVAMEVDVVRAKHLYPRALLTPFTDDVDLTAADEAAYTGAAKAQRFKGFEDIDVRFDDPDDKPRLRSIDPRG